MLKKLTIKNFAIIEDITIDFDDKLTALTGQTGAGKSLIIDSLNLLLGSRAISDMIRYDETKATVTGFITNINDSAKEYLRNLGMVCDDITIYREIKQNSKNTIKVNDVNFNLNQLKQLGLYLADIHVQHDTFRLINPENYLFFLDKYGDKSLTNAYNEYQIKYNSYQSSLKKFQEIEHKNKQLDMKLDYLKYQYEELTNFNLIENEDVELEEIINKLENYDKIYNGLNKAYEELDSIDNIYNASDFLQKIGSYDHKYEEYSEKLRGFFYESEDIKLSLKKSIDSLDFDQELLNSSIERQKDLKNLLNKYHLNLNELIIFYNNIKEEIMISENFDEFVKELKEKVDIDFKALENVAKTLTEERKKTALKLQKQLILECFDLDLENVQFEIHFDNIEVANSLINPNGFDNINFLVSFNKGEPVKPLYNCASGGELSRIMLGFKKIFADIQNLSLIVFDEIDTGISGESAAKMARKIKQISEKTQVLCITHLPHVASIADNHIHIYKDYDNERTKTGIKKLSYDERVIEIAHMISGNKISSYAIENAKELLNN